jgi:hypothetical protein
MSPESFIASTGPLQPSNAAGPAFDYDVFVSYGDEDEEWCRAELLEPLQQAELKITHKGMFEWGAPIADAHARAVERSRWTIIVLTPAWCHSQWEALDRQLATTQDPAAVYRRLLPLKVQDCMPPARIANLVSRDFSQPQKRRAMLADLLKELGRSAQAIDKAFAQTATKGMAALGELMRIDTVQDAVRGSKESFKNASERIDVVKKYKDLHDCFQRTENAYKSVLTAKELYAAKPDKWDHLESAVRDLMIELEKLLSNARTKGFPPDEILWAAKVDRVRQDLDLAMQNEDAKPLDAIHKRLNSVIGTVPSRLNKELVHVAKQLALGKVSEKLFGVRDTLAPTWFDDEVKARLVEFTKGIESLDRLDQSLRILITAHNCLQAIDDNLRSIELTQRPALSEIAEIWIDLQEPLATLLRDGSVPWAARLRTLTEALQQSLQEPTTDPQAMRKTLKLFRDFRNLVYLGFNQADEDLKIFCGQLQKVGETLANTIAGMQHV